MTTEFPPFAIWPPADSPVSVLTYLREVAALSKVAAAPPPFPEDAARGSGHPVIVVPGFFSLDVSTRRLREFLARQDFAVRSWDCGANIGPTRTALAEFERQLTDAAGRNGKPISLVGVSLGGTIAREMAKRRPDCVASVITIASPIKLSVATPLAPLARLTALVWDSDARDAFSRLAEPPPVPLTAIVNPNDGVLDWRACVPDPMQGVEVIMISGAHMTMPSNPEVQRVIAARLAKIGQDIGEPRDGDSDH